MRHTLYLASWFLQTRILGKQKPLQTVLFISNQCNLSCRHCNIVHRKEPLVSKSYETIREELAYSYAAGSRFVDFEGGEPLLWRDGKRRFNDLIDLARNIGFFSATLTTNGQLPFQDCRADSIWVSLDGLGDYHDEIRGKGSFKRLEHNLAQCGHPRTSLNMVINRLNYPSVKETIEFAKSNPAVQSISLNFHTPFPGAEDLFLDWETRQKLLDEIILMKRQGYPIMNSISGLRLMRNNDFTKHCWVTNFIMPDGHRLTECPGKTHDSCEHCGLGMSSEMHAVFSFKPDTLMAGMKLRCKKLRRHS